MAFLQTREQRPGDKQSPPLHRSQLTVYYDGSCPLCSAEISHYRKIAPAEHIRFEDVSAKELELDPRLDKPTLMSRFHVRRSDGTLISGAAAFVSVWRLLPGWRWAACAAAFPGATLLLEILYRLFLPIRPGIARVLNACSRTGDARNADTYG